PDVAIRRGDDALHRTQLSAEVVAGLRGKRPAGVKLEDGDRFAAKTGDPHLVIGGNGEAEAGAVKAAAAIPERHRRKRPAIRRELRNPAAKVAVDRGLRTHKEVIARPQVTLAIKGDATRRVQPAAGIDQGQGPRTRREAEVRDEGHRPPTLPGGNRIERIKQREELLRLIRWVACDVLRRR